MINKKDIFFLLFSSLLILIFIFPIISYGNRDLEEYQLGFFTLNTYYNNPKSFIDKYIDYYGVGSVLPIGHYPFLHISHLFLNNLKIFFLLYFFLNLLIQVYFFKKIILFYEIKFHNLFVIPIIFSISNFNYVFSDDWGSVYFSYSLFFPILYYFEKYLKKNKDLFKLVGWICYQFLNGHVGAIAPLYVFLLIYFFTLGNFDIFKSRDFYLGLILCFSICFGKIYFLVDQSNEFPESLDRLVQSSYTLQTFILSNLLPYSNTGWSINRNPFYGIIFLSSLIFGFKYFVNSGHIKKITYLFYLFIALSFTNYSKYFYVLSGVWWFRDIFNILAVIIFFQLFNDHKKIFFFIFSIFIIQACLFYNYNFQNHIDLDGKNYFNQTKNNKSEDFISFLNRNKNNKGEKTYLSKNFERDVRNGFREYGLYSVTDLIDNGIYPFNGWFKNISMDDITPSKVKMHGWIKFDNNQLNNNFFLQNFMIKQGIFYRNEMSQIKVEYEILETFSLNNKKEIVLIKFNYKGFPTLNSNIKTLKNNCKNNKKLINCLLNKENFYLSNKLKIDKKKTNNFEITNTYNSNKKIIFPFYDFMNWQSSIKLNSVKISNQFFLVEIPRNSKIEFSYKNKIRFINLIIFLLGVSVLIYKLFFNGKKISKTDLNLL